jgi:hypothetical protein
MAALLASVPGCTSRSITVTTNPPGAEVTVNYRLVGVTPCRVGFTHYGTYRIEIRKEKYKTLVKEECVNPPAYGYEPISFVTDNAIPARLNDDIYFHYVLKPEGEVSERTALLERANRARDGFAVKSDGSEVHVAYTVPEKTPDQAAKIAQQNAADEKAKAAAAALPANNDFKIKQIPTEEPKGPTISKDLNIKVPTPEKKPETVKPPEAPKEPRKDQPVRTPKSEELIFEKPAEPKKEEKKP